MTKDQSKTVSDPVLNARDDPEWWKARNARRRQRYAEDTEYREGALKMSRSTYRSKSPSQPFDPRINLAKLDDFGKVRMVTFPDGRRFERWCMTKADAARVLGRSTKLFYHWINDGRFPDTVLVSSESFIRDYRSKKGVQITQPVGVYAPEEVVAAVHALGQHFTRVHYYRVDHVQVREEVFTAVRNARGAIGIQCDDTAIS